MQCWHIYGLKLWNLVRFLSFLLMLSGTGKWLSSKSGQISVKRQYFWIICVKSNLTFCRKEIWSFLKILDYWILEELINLRLKRGFFKFGPSHPNSPTHLILQEDLLKVYNIYYSQSFPVYIFSYLWQSKIFLDILVFLNGYAFNFYCIICFKCIICFNLLNSFFSISVLKISI